MTAALRVKVAMAVKGMSINKVALASGVSHTTVTTLVAGRTATSWQSLLAVAHVLDVHFEWLAECRNPPKLLLDMLQAPITEKVWL